MKMKRQVTMKEVITKVMVNFKCLFKRDTTWEKIEHVRNIRINEVSDEKTI